MRKMIALLMAGALTVGGTVYTFADAVSEAASENTTDAADEEFAEAAELSEDDLVENENSDWYMLTDDFEAYIPNDWVDLMTDDEEEGTIARIGTEDEACYVQVIEADNTDGLTLEEAASQMADTGTYDNIYMCNTNNLEGVIGTKDQTGCYLTISGDGETITQFIITQPDDSYDQVTTNLLASLQLVEEDAETDTEA